MKKMNGAFIFQCYRCSTAVDDNMAAMTCQMTTIFLNHKVQAYAY